MEVPPIVSAGLVSVSCRLLVACGLGYRDLWPTTEYPEGLPLPMREVADFEEIFTRFASSHSREG
jgi:hypothetical protein